MVEYNHVARYRRAVDEPAGLAVEGMSRSETDFGKYGGNTRLEYIKFQDEIS
jgi:hypothetical protein